MDFNKEIYTAHINDIEKVNEMKKLLDKIFIVIRNHSTLSTDFYDPYEIYLAKSILNRFDDINYHEVGGLQDSERKIMMLYPNYYEKKDIEDEISFLRLSGSLENLKHKDYLGSILGLGINRSKVGDILIHKDYTDVVVKKEISEYIIFNLEKIGKQKVSVLEIQENDLIPVDLEYKEINLTVSSLRLDTIISSIYNISRQESAKLINSEAVKVNFEKIDKTYREVNENDLISTRSYGRAIFESIDGLSRKGKFRITVRLLI